ncbi:MAG: assembly factor cbp4 [Sclerophora amabilis]|nr:MAG: assembly factor cbp4 [Sclerophora amabilis]
MAPNYGLWAKLIAASALMMVGGPALIHYVTPTEEELFKRYNPDLQRRSLEGRETRQREFDDFVARLKEHSKSDKPIWVVAAEEDARMKAQRAEERRRETAEAEQRRQELKRQSVAPGS